MKYLCTIDCDPFRAGLIYEGDSVIFLSTGFKPLDKCWTYNDCEWEVYKATDINCIKAYAAETDARQALARDLQNRAVACLKDADNYLKQAQNVLDTGHA